MIEKRKQYSQDTFLQVQDNVFVERGMVYSNQKVHLTPLKFSHKSLGSSQKILQLGMILKTFKSYSNYNVTVMIVATYSKARIKPLREPTTFSIFKFTIKLQLFHFQLTRSTIKKKRIYLKNIK